MLAIVIALISAALVVPRAAPPQDLPLPHVDRAAQRRAQQVAETRADDAERTGLPYTVRAVGEGMRRLGALALAGTDTAGRVTDLRRRVVVARRAHGDPPLLALRAVQQRLFLNAMDRWLQTGTVDAELRELGGDFPEHATKLGWVQAGRLLVPRGDVGAVFNVRWTAVCGLLDDRSLGPDLNEWRAYYRTNLSHPAPSGAHPDELPRMLLQVAELARKDPDYPADVATGALLFQLGRMSEAAAAFQRHLTSHGSGPWTLRARSHLAACVANAPEAA